MNAAEFNTEIKKVIARALKEGVAENKLTTESLVGILEHHKYQVFEWRTQMLIMAAQAKAAEVPLILPANGHPVPPRPPGLA